MNTLAEVAYKTCMKCNESKTLDCFGKLTKSKDGLRSECKECRKQYYLDNSEKEKARTMRWYLDNPERKKASDRKYRLDNPEKANARSKKYALDNPEKVKAAKRKYRLANPEKTADRRKKWDLDNREQARSRCQVRRARKLANGVFKISVTELIKLYASPCFYCGSKDLIEADHVIPISRGGRHSIGNLVPACRSCNGSKGKKLLVEWKKNSTFVINI